MSASNPGYETWRAGPGDLRVVVVPNADAAAEIVVGRIRDLATRPEPARLGVATGATFAPTYERLVAEASAGRLDMSPLEVTHLDEYLGVGPDTPGGMVHELGERLLSRLSGKRLTFHPVPGAADNPAATHQALLDALGPLDLQLLGIGGNGHVAFNEPGTPFRLRTHVANLAPETVSANAARFPDGEHPRSALTMGPAAILSARSLLLVATGSGKATAVRDLLEGPVGPHCPATLLRLHPDADVVIDQEAASLLTSKARWRPDRHPVDVVEARELRPPGPVVVISPHPDDASISCGGLLASLPPETPRHILTMTTGSRARVPGDLPPAAVADLREHEVRDEARILSAEASFLRCRYYDTGAFEADDVERLRTYLQSLQPAWLIAPARADPHPTHRLTRLVLDEAVCQLRHQGSDPMDVWSFEGPWYQHPAGQVNTLVLFDPTAEECKLRAVRAHSSQTARVPFHEGAAALARLRAVTFSESHLGGKDPGNLDQLPLVETYVRETY